jgi:NADPH:quinone reductase-like Zn-dependent oxidoreductase
VTGKLAVRIAKLLGAARVVAAGRNRQVLSTLAGLGADLIIPLEVSEDELRQAFASAISSSGVRVVIYYLWGRPVEVLLSAMTRHEFAVSTSETRLVQVGESAGSRVSLPASVLRSRALTILGTLGIPPRDVLVDALQKVLAHAARGELSIDTESVPLADIEKARQRESQGCRLVVVP